MVGEPNTISIKVTFTDTDFYENFIEPRKINSELPSLVCRLLTVYANDEELANRIDQSFDEQEDPEIYEARANILNALSKMSELDAMAEQELYNLDATEDNLTGSDDTVDSNVSDAGIIAPEVEADDEESNFFATNKPPQILDKTVNHKMPTTVMPNMQAMPTKNDSSIVLEGLNTLTTQVSALTAAVSQMVTAISATTVPHTIGEVAQMTSPMQNAYVAPAPQPVVAQPEPAIPEPIIPEPIQTTTDTGLAALDAVANATDTDSSDSNDSNEYEIPDFMDDMINSLG